MVQKQQKLKRGQLFWAILEIICLGVISGGGSPLKPTLPLVISTIYKLLKEARRLNIEEKKILRTLKNLEKREIISIIEQNNEVYIQLIDNNHPSVIKYSLQFLLDFKKKDKKWDGKWFMVFFDVPEIQRNKRNYLRNLLTKVGFYRYQKSVYIFPFDCKEEINLIKKIVESAKYMKYIIAEQIEDEEEIKRFFNL